MEKTIAYRENFSNDGTHYNQRITLRCTEDELKTLNRSVRKLRKEKPNAFKDMFQNLKEGSNPTCLTFRNFLLQKLNLENNKRVKDYNTIFKVILKKN